MKSLNKYMTQKVKLRNVNNPTEATEHSRNFRALVGAAMMVREQGPDNIVRSKLYPFGIVTATLWFSFYFYCLYKVFMEDQSIVRNIYATKLKHYGDIFENIASTIMFLYTVWKIPVDLSGNPVYIQKWVDVDKALEKLGVLPHYNKTVTTIFVSCMIEVGICIVYLLSIICLGIPLPFEVIYQGIIFDAYSLTCMTHYYHFIIEIRSKFKILNSILTEIEDGKSWEHMMFMRGRQPRNMLKVNQLRDKYICEKIKACAKIYGMLSESCNMMTNAFGVPILLTFLFGMCFMILNLFYFMEATAGGLFNDDPLKYMYLIIHLFWRIGYSFAIMYTCVLCGELTVSEALKTPSVTHKIINSDVSPSVAEEATQLSLLLLQQRPVFTYCWVFTTSYELLLEVGRTVLTFLVMLLQYAAE